MAPPGNTDTASELSSLRSEISRLTELIGQRVSREAESAGQSLMGTVDELGKRGREAASMARSKAMETSTELEEAITRRPWTAVMIAGGIGLILGMMSARND